MKNRLLLHDLDAAHAAVFGPLPEDVIELTPDSTAHHCVGCFKCWTNTPGVCVFTDKIQAAPAMLAASDEFIIVSRNVYGGFSPAIKSVLDRSIGYIMPFFRIVEGEMHHTMRYENPFSLTVHFYGENLSDVDKEIAQTLISAIALNLGAGSNHVHFSDSIDALKGVFS